MSNEPLPGDAWLVAADTYIGRVYSHETSGYNVSVYSSCAQVILYLGMIQGEGHLLLTQSGIVQTWANPAGGKIL